MTEKMIRDAYCRIRTIDQTIPDEVLDFMRDASIEKLNQALRIHDVVGRSEQLKAFCQYCETRQIQPKRFNWDEVIKDFESL